MKKMFTSTKIFAPSKLRVSDKNLIDQRISQRG